MMDAKIIINIALGAIIAAAIIFSAWYVLGTRQMAAQNAAGITEIVNFINTQLESAAAQNPQGGLPQGTLQNLQEEASSAE